MQIVVLFATLFAASKRFQVCTGSPSVSPRWPCRNGDYRISAKRRYPPNGGPSAELARQHAFMNFPRRWRHKRMLEIGGPTADVDIYRLVASADNAVLRNRFSHFGQRTEDLQGQVLGDDFDGAPFVVGDDGKSGPRQTVGTLYQRDGAQLHGFADESYEVVFASHTLEHFIDPLRALTEWDRVLKRGGDLLLILPFAPRTFDRYIAPSNMQELLHLHFSNASSNEALLRARLDARLRLFPPDYEMGDLWPDSTLYRNNTFENKKAVLWNSVVSLCDETQTLGRGQKAAGAAAGHPCSTPRVDESLWHWHVWDFDLLQEVVGDCFGYNIMWMQFHEPYHQLMLAQKP